ncbi:MAG: ribbon-helix-helix domain-containing protein [Caulobacter sp.]|nr:ribbon-helix-helix domain-containing protein [Caulobacter sp.]
MAGGLKKRSVNLAGHATSLALEPEFWAVLDRAAAADGVSLSGLIARIDEGRGARALASACRVFALLNPPPQGEGDRAERGGGG